MTETGIRLVRGACPHDCPDTCATVTEVQDGRAVRFYAEKEHPVTQGWLCAKVRPYLERVYHPDRITHPLRRAGPKGAGQWERISWDAAIDEIASRWKAIIAEYGAAAILPYSYSGTLGLLQLSICNARLWNRMGASRSTRSRRVGRRSSPSTARRPSYPIPTAERSACSSSASATPACGTAWARAGWSARSAARRPRRLSRPRLEHAGRPIRPTFCTASSS